MKLFSILISDHPASDGSALPPAIARNIASFREHHPTLPHVLYDQDAIRTFLRTQMEPDVAWAYEELLPYAYRADLARLCLLHEFGGVYADLSVFFHAGLPVESGKMLVFRDRAVDAPWIVSNTIIGAPPRAPALEAAIRMIVANCRRRYRGVSSLCPTGPVLLGKAIALHCEPEQIHLGEASNVSQREAAEAIVFVDTTDGRLIGYRSKPGAGLHGLGLDSGVNNYNDFYYARLIYAADYPVFVDAAWLARHGRTAATLQDGTLVFHGDPAGGAATVLACGLPFPFAAGRYRILLELAHATAGAVVTLAAATRTGANLAQVEQRIDRDGHAVLALALDTVSRNDVVVAILAAQTACLRLAGVRIERLMETSAS